MSRIFSFNAQRTCEKTNIIFDALCISYDKGTVESSQFFSDLTNAIKDLQTLPDCLIIMADKSIINNLYNFWETDSNNRDAIKNRSTKGGYQFVKNYYFYEWDINKLNYKLFKTDSKNTYNIVIDDFIEEGLKTLVSKNPVIQFAPSGHAFKHPSGNVNKLFIQTREIAINEPELCFVAKAIASNIGVLFKEVEVVFIDTMGIYHIVKKALNAVENTTARIKSFHSYIELKNTYPPSNNSNYFCIISASTSGNMAKELIEQQKFESSKILTLIDISKRTEKILIVADEYNNISENGDETEIELVGEHFTSRAKPPKAVTLSHAHAPKALEAILKYFGKDGFESLNSKPEESKESKLVCLNSSKIWENADFKKWLSEELTWSFSFAIDHIIHTNDLASKNIAILVQKEIKKITKKRKNIPLIAQSELNSDNIKNAKGVLAVTAVAGDGSEIRTISRDLREYAPLNAPRHFLIAVGLPQTNSKWLRLKQFLEKNHTKRNYGFSNWLMLPIGYDGKDTTWSELIELASEMPHFQESVKGISQNIVNDSLESAKKFIGKSYYSFLPKNNDEKLALTNGYVFFGNAFDKDTKYGELPDSTVYLSITSVLQSAREIKDKNICLASTGYETVVLDPECFSRFDDNILQACLLRACHKSELDYSASPHLSGLMREFLIKVFNRHAYKYGDTALEFAAALAIGKLKLKKEDLKLVLDKTIDSLKNEASALLGFLIIVHSDNKDIRLY